MPLAKVQDNSPIIDNVKHYYRSAIASGSNTIEASQAGKKVRILYLILTALGAYEIDFDVEGGLFGEVLCTEGTTLVINLTGFRIEYSIDSDIFGLIATQIAVGRYYVHVYYELLDE